jgi:hypothetical protein
MKLIETPAQSDGHEVALVSLSILADSSFVVRPSRPVGPG